MSKDSVRPIGASRVVLPNRGPNPLPIPRIESKFKNAARPARDQGGAENRADSICLYRQFLPPLPQITAAGRISVERDDRELLIVVLLHPRVVAEGPYERL